MSTTILVTDIEEEIPQSQDGLAVVAHEAGTRHHVCWYKKPRERTSDRYGLSDAFKTDARQLLFGLLSWRIPMLRPLSRIAYIALLIWR